METITLSDLLDNLLKTTHNVGSNGFIRYVDHMGSDMAICDAARISYGVTNDTDYPIDKQKNLINYLMSHGHTTPFEMCEVKFHVKVPMDTWRQWIRHRTANVNEYSTRYKPAIDDTAYTLTSNWRLQSSNNKQGSDGFLSARGKGQETGSVWDEVNGNELSKREREFHSHSKELYEHRLAVGIAKEQARKDLPLSTYTEAYWKCDLHNIFNFLRLRMDSHAQLEIREYANTMGLIIEILFPLAWDAFMCHKLKAITLSDTEIFCIHNKIWSKYLSQRDRQSLKDKCSRMCVDTAEWIEGTT